MARGGSVCHTVYPFVQSAFPANAHCSEPLVWFRSSGVLTGTPLGSPSAALSHGDPSGILPQEQPLPQKPRVAATMCGLVGVGRPCCRHTHPDLSGQCFHHEPGCCLGPRQGPCLSPRSSCSWGLCLCLPVFYVASVGHRNQT